MTTRPASHERGRRVSVESNSGRWAEMEDSDLTPSLSLNRQVAPQPVQSPCPASWPPLLVVLLRPPFCWPLFSGQSSWCWQVAPWQLRPSFAPTDAVKLPELLFYQPH